MTKVANFGGMQASLLEEALRLARLGFRVIPLSGKTPLVKSWPQVSTRDEAAVRVLFQRRDVTGIGIVLDDPIVVIDFDPRNGGDWADYDLPATVVCHTGGGGRHYYYRLPAGVKSQSRKLFPGVDLKGAGGYVVAPPSQHPSGGEYVWEVGGAPWEREIALAPAWVVEELVGRGERAYRTSPPIRKGERHNYLVSLAGALCGAGVGEAEVEAVLREVYDRFFEKEDFDIDRELTYLRRYYEKWRGDGSVQKVLQRLPAKVGDVVAKVLGYDEERFDGKQAGQRARRKLEEAIEALQAARWVEWGGVAYIVKDNILIPADNAVAYLASVGVFIGADLVKQAVNYVTTFKGMPELRGVVLGEYMVEGEAAGVRGVWRHDGGRLYCYTSEGVRVWEEVAWPEGVYRVARARGVRMGEGGISDLVSYMRIACSRVETDARVVTAMLAPILLGAGDAGFILTGPAGSGKSTFAKALAMLERGREWAFPVGTHIRDYLASLTAQRVTFFDDAAILSSDLQALLRSKITHSWANVRALYKDTDIIERKLEGSMILCTTAVEDLTHDLADRCFYIRFENKGARVREDILMKHFEENCDKARAGLIELWRRALEVEVPAGILPQVRFRKWVEAAYRMAVVLGVGDEFVRYIKLSKLNSLGSLKYGFLVEAFANGLIETDKPYRLRDIWESLGNDPEDANLYSLAKGLGRGQKNRREIETIAQAFSYDVRFEKQVLDKEKGRPELVMIFTRKDEEVVYDEIQLDEVQVERAERVEARRELPMQVAASERGESPLPYPLLACAEWEAMAGKLMKGVNIEYDTQNEYVQIVRELVEEHRQKDGDVGVVYYITNLLNSTINEFKAEEFRDFVIYLLTELAKARRAICEKS